MRNLGRIVFLMTAISLGSGRARAQDPNVASPEPDPTPIAAPMLDPAAQPPEGSVTRPDEEPPAIQTEAAPVEAPNPESPVIEIAPLAPPPSVESAVETAARFSRPEAEDPVRGQRPSDWVFLGILALAVVVIIGRLTHTKQETVSIHDGRSTRQNPGPKAPGPPIVRHT